MVWGSDRLSSFTVAWHQILMFYGNCSCCFWFFLCVLPYMFDCVLFSTLPYHLYCPRHHPVHMTLLPRKVPSYLVSFKKTKLSILLQHNVVLPSVFSAEVAFLLNGRKSLCSVASQRPAQTDAYRASQQSRVSETHLAVCRFFFYCFLFMRDMKSLDKKTSLSEFRILRLMSEFWEKKSELKKKKKSGPNPIT